PCPKLHARRDAYAHQRRARENKRSRQPPGLEQFSLEGKAAGSSSPAALPIGRTDPAAGNVVRADRSASVIKFVRRNLPKSFMQTVSRRREIMKRLVTRLCVVALALGALAVVRAQTPGARFTVQEMLRIQRVADPQLSPDGRLLAYQITVPDVAANRSRTQIYLIAVNGGEPKQLTSGAASASEPRWSPD